MKIISEPLIIGAADLLKGVDYSHYGVLFVHAGKKTIGNPWKQRYVILSEGCLYIYKNKNSKTTKDSYSLQHFEYVRISEPESEENICFCLHYNNWKPPKLFSCDTPETREEWIKKLGVEMTYVQKMHNLSADSGFGSAGAVPAFRESGTYELDKKGQKYDTVNERRLFSKEDQKGVQTHRNVIHEQDEEENDYEPINYSAVPNSCKGINEIEPENQGVSDGIRAIEEKLQIKPKIFMEELKSKFNTENRGLSSIVGKEPETHAHLLRRDSATSNASSFVSVQGGVETSDKATNLPSHSFKQTQVVEKEPTTHVHLLRRDSAISNASSFVSVQGGDETSDNIIHSPSQLLIQTQGHGKKIPIETKPTSFMAELSLKLKSGHKGLANVEEGTISHETPLRRDSKISIASSFLSIHGGHETSDDVKSVSSESEQWHEIYK